MAARTKSPQPKVTESGADTPDSVDQAAPPAVVTPDIPQFEFQPAGGGEAIIVPAVANAIPPEKHRWFFWKLRKLRGLDQPIFWLEQAGIPDAVQEQIMLLPDQEWGRFFSEWMANAAPEGDDAGGATLGE